MTTSYYELPTNIQSWQQEQWKILLDQRQKSQAVLRQLEDLKRAEWQAAVSNTPGQQQEKPSKARKRKFADVEYNDYNPEDHHDEERQRRWRIRLPLECFCPVIEHERVATDGERERERERERESETRQI